MKKLVFATLAVLFALCFAGCELSAPDDSVVEVDLSRIGEDVPVSADILPSYYPKETIDGKATGPYLVEQDSSWVIKNGKTVMVEINYIDPSVATDYPELGKAHVLVNGENITAQLLLNESKAVSLTFTSVSYDEALKVINSFYTYSE